MVDVLTKEQRQRNMRNIKGKDTKPEMVLRNALHARGLRYRLHRQDMPGCPDLVFPKYRAVVFVHGCFWHRHGCKYTSTPSTRKEFWAKKFLQNIKRDEEALKELEHMGWRVYVAWECQLKKRHGDINSVCNDVIAFLIKNVHMPPD